MIRDNQARAKRALQFLYVTGILEVANIGADIWQYDLLTNHIDDMATIQLSDTVQFWLGITSICVSIATIITFIHWFRRAYYNLRIINPSAATLEEGWAAGAWFVPILNWWRPFSIMKEIWYGTRAAYGGAFRTQVPDNLLVVWWVLWVVSSILNNIANRLRLKADTVDAFQSCLILSIIGTALSMAALVCIIAIIRKFLTLEKGIAELGEQPSDSIFAVHRPLHIEEAARENSAE